MAAPEQSYPFSLQALYIALANGNGSWGAIMKLASANKIDITEKHVVDHTEGNSRYTATASQIVAIEASIDAGGYDPNVIKIIEGVNNTTSSGVNRQRFDNHLMPYFGIVGQAWDEFGGDLLVWIPYAKIMSDVTYGMGFGKILVAKFKVMGIAEPILDYIWDDYQRDVTSVVTTFPPV